MAIDANIHRQRHGNQPSAVSSSAIILQFTCPRPSAGLWRDAAPPACAATRRRWPGLMVVALLVVIAVLAPAIVPYDPNDQSFRIKLKPPSTEHWLGTDEFGRDMLSRILVGTRVALVRGHRPGRQSRSSSGSRSDLLPGITAAASTRWSCA